MSSDEASAALGAPLSYVRGGRGNELLLALPNVKGSALTIRSDGLYLQFRKGRLTRMEGRLGNSQAVVGGLVMRADWKTAILLAAFVGTMASAPVQAQTYGERPQRYGNTASFFFYDNRDDQRDFPTNGVFPGNFATDPFFAGVGAAGWLGSNPQHQAMPYPSQTYYGRRARACRSVRIPRRAPRRPALSALPRALAWRAGLPLTHNLRPIAVLTVNKRIRSDEAMVRAVFLRAAGRCRRGIAMPCHRHGRNHELRERNGDPGGKLRQGHRRQLPWCQSRCDRA